MQRENSEAEVDQIDSLEVFEMIRLINDPEHPLTLQVGVWVGVWRRGKD